MGPIYSLALMSLALLAQAAADGGQKQLLEQLCRLDKQSPAVDRVSDVKSMIELLKADSSVNCEPEVRDTILALEPVIRLQNVCSEEAADAIVDFWANNVQGKAKARKYLPKPLKRFFLAFGFQVNRVCKRTLLEVLEEATKETGITEEDFKFVINQVGDKVENIFGTDLRLEDLLLIVRTDRSKNIATGKREKAKLKLHPLEAKHFQLRQERCANKFKPLYDTLILPAVRLASIGLSYRGEPDASQMLAFRNEPAFRSWFTVVVACEPILRYDVVVVPKEKVTAEGDSAMITVMDDDDLEELERTLGSSLEELEVSELADYQVQVQLKDLIVDEQMGDVAAAYKQRAHEMKRIRVKMAKKLPYLIKTYVKRNAVKIGMSEKQAYGFGENMSKKSKLRWLRFGMFCLGGLIIGGIITGVFFLAAAVHPLLALWFVVGFILVAIVASTTLFAILGAEDSLYG